MKTALLITIDVESDDLWAHKPEITLDNIAAMPRLQEFFARHEVRATWLLTYPVASSRIGREVFGPLSRTGSGEIGSHMHVWTTPPLRPLTAADHAYCPLATEIPPDELRAKLQHVTDAVGELAGQRPVSHRAGRYALDGAGLRVLEELGYRADTSVTPLLDWQEKSHTGGWRGPDFRDAPWRPYFPDYADVARPGASPVLEVPVSFFLSRRLPFGWTSRVARLPRNSAAARLFRWSGWSRHAWLRPGRDVDGATLVGVAQTLIAEGIPLLNLMFHSSEMAVGTSPHTRTAADVEDSYAQLDFFFRAMRGRVQPMTLGEFAGAYPAARAEPAAACVAG
jgi:peptidoglycan/xylan/chitin deacetylase (PgdA/CDA1 family)